MKGWLVKLPVIAILALAVFILLSPPVQTSAGGLPCFTCHGSELQGSDIAPSVADTNLTDEEIIRQIGKPRGLMPAFPEFANQDIVNFIRALPTGQPTAALSHEQRSVALATIAVVAAARSTEFAHLAQQDSGATTSAAPVASSSTPTPTVAPSDTPSAASLAPASNTVPPSATPSRAPLLSYTLIGGVMVAIGVVLLVWAQLKN